MRSGLPTFKADASKRSCKPTSATCGIVQWCWRSYRSSMRPTEVLAATGRLFKALGAGFVVTKVNALAGQGTFARAASS